MAESRRPSKRRKTAAVDKRTEDTKSFPAHAPMEDTAHLEQRRSLFVRSLPSNTTSESLAEHFSQSYPIKHAVAVTDRETKQCKGYGFVTFTDAEDAQRACQDFNGSELLGKKIKVEIAEPRHREEDGESKVQRKAPQGRPQQQDGSAEQQPPRLIVRNLPWSIKEPEQLSNLFRSYGKIKHATVPKKGGKLIGFGIVVIRGRKNAEKAIAGVNGKEIDGRTLAVDWAVDKDTWEKIKEDAPAEENSNVETDGQDGKEVSETGDAEEHLGDGSDIASDDSDNVEGEVFEDETDEEDDADQTNSSTVFIRNLPFSCTDEDLYDHFRQFGALRYARIVLDPNTERSRGTGFVCFFQPEDCAACLTAAPKAKMTTPFKSQKDNQTLSTSVLQDENSDPSGRFTLEGRVLQLSQAVGKSEAARLTEEGQNQRDARDKDKRRLYLLSEGTIATNSPLYALLSPSEIAMREASAKQRKTLIQSNPSLHLSLTRLSIRNIPRSITSKDLKALARDAVVGFAKDVKEGNRQPLSKEERYRGFEDMKQAEHERKMKAKGVVKQAKVVFEGREGSKVKEADGVGRSRGYGFIEYHTHRSALMGLRWLNGHAVGRNTKVLQASAISPDDFKDRKKRLIVEFAIENAQVVGRRKEKEVKARSGDQTKAADRINHKMAKSRRAEGKKTLGKRKRSEANDEASAAKKLRQVVDAPIKDDKLAKRNRIIAKKRAMRRDRKRG